MDPAKLNLVAPSIIPGLIDPSITKVLLASGDDAAILWIDDQTKTRTAVEALLQDPSLASIMDVWSGERLKLHYPDPLSDPRAPDIIVIGYPGTIYTTANKIAEHGGYSEQDNNVPIVISHPALIPKTIKSPVQTAQVAPTILQLLGLSPYLLEAVVIEKTPVLPGFEAVQIVANSTNAPGIPVSSVKVSEGESSFVVSLAGLDRLTIEASSDLAHWSPIATNQFLVSGAATIHDAEAPKLAKRFYRAVKTPQ